MIVASFDPLAHAYKRRYTVAANIREEKCKKKKQKFCVVVELESEISRLELIVNASATTYLQRAITYCNIVYIYIIYVTRTCILKC